jgi:transposase
MQVYIGIDWSEQKHDVVFQNAAGATVLQLSVAHSQEGFLRLDAARQQMGVAAAECGVGLETAHNLLIDFLWSRSYEQIYVLPPSQVNSSQGRLRQSGARSDGRDAGLIAELVRTDRHRLYPWQPGSAVLQQMRAKIGLIGFLTKQIVRYTNRLRAVLLRYYPAALRVFSGLETQITLSFIRTYPTPQQAADLDFASFCQFAKAQGYSQPKRLGRNFARLQQPQPQPAAATVQAFCEEAVLLAEQLSHLLRAKARQLRSLQQLYEQHPDRFIFDSLPMAGTLSSAGLLVKFGEDRQRFPQASQVQALAGTCPVTVQSGKGRRVSFRKACDREFRYLVQEWARLTIQESVWAADYCQQVRSRTHSNQQAYRCLANRWLAIVWKLWQDRLTYDEAFLLRKRLERRLPPA